MCPYYLDGDLRAAYAALGDTRVIGYCAVFKDREEVSSADCRGRSLKTQQHAAASRGCKPMRATFQARSTLLEPIALEESAAELALRRHRPKPRHGDPAGDRCPWLKGSLERR
jgi:hypothetical protein